MDDEALERHAFDEGGSCVAPPVTSSRLLRREDFGRLNPWIAAGIVSAAVRPSARYFVRLEMSTNRRDSLK